LAVAGQAFDCANWTATGGPVDHISVPDTQVPVGDVANVFRLDDGFSGVALCGNGAQDAGEECDDGNYVGGDGCAANCTVEDRRVGVFSPTQTYATIQTEAIPITLNVTGQEIFRTGRARVTDTLLADGSRIDAFQIPFVSGLRSCSPTRYITGLACLRSRHRSMPSDPVTRVGCDRLRRRGPERHLVPPRPGPQHHAGISGNFRLGTADDRV
jgi:cysteine-rich repeat protein